MNRVVWAAVGLVCALLLAGCASVPTARFRKAGPDTACLTPTVAQDTVVGVALSGGGSRAALFAAAGLEALGRLPAPPRVGRCSSRSRTSPASRGAD